MPNSKILENFSNGLCLLFLGIVTFELYIGTPSIDTSNRFWVDIIKNIVFINVTHIILTYFLLLSFPEIRKWIVITQKIKRISFWNKAFLFLIVLFLANFSVKYYSQHMFLGIPLANYELVAWIALPLHHAIYQVMGISFLLSKGTSSIIKNLGNNFLFERFVYRTIFYISIALLGIRFSAITGPYVQFAIILLRVVAFA